MVAIEVPDVIPGDAHVFPLPKRQATATTGGTGGVVMLLTSLTRGRLGGWEGGREEGERGGEGRGGEEREGEGRGGEGREGEGREGKGEMRGDIADSRSE